MHKRRTKIIATLGPATNTQEKIRILVKKGVNVFRLNFSHGTHEEHLERIHFIREIEHELQHPIGILADLQGPKLRLGDLPSGEIEVQNGDMIRIFLDQATNNQSLCLPHKEVFEAIEPGHRLLFDDGKLICDVIEANSDHALLKFQNGGRLLSRKGVCLPDSVLRTGVLTKKDIADISIIKGAGVDWVAMSFVQSAEDINILRNLLEPNQKIIAKIERRAAIDCLDEIVEAADAVMVARGDLGVELPPESVPQLQETIVRRCKSAGKPVIVATQMLESMCNSPVPTRAEIQDVATSVLQSVDAVMLSGETAAGWYPSCAVDIMSRTVAQAESTSEPANQSTSLKMEQPQRKKHRYNAVACAANLLSERISAKCIVVFTRTGAAAAAIAHIRPQVPVISVAESLCVARELNLMFGISSSISNMDGSHESYEAFAIRLAMKEHEFASGDYIVVVSGTKLDEGPGLNSIRMAAIP